jgi:DNA-binding response OmpR family regulator
MTSPKGHPFPDMDVYDDSCLHIEHKRYFFTVKGVSVTLTRTEFRVLSRLVKGIDEIVSFEDLWEHGWNPKKPFKLKTVHVFVSRIRGKLAPHGLKINSVVGVGYILSHGSCCPVREKMRHRSVSQADSI